MRPAGGGTKMRRSLPQHSNLEVIEKEARHLLHQVRRGDTVSVARWYSLDSEARTFQPGMADIRYLIAREYGFRSWQSLKDRLNEKIPAGRARVKYF